MKQKNADDVDKDVPSLKWQRDVCFGCGMANANGLRLKFVLSPDGKSYVCDFQLSSCFSGPPRHAHGGIIATILDEAMSKAIKLKSRVALTRHIEVEYLRPVPLEQLLKVEGRVSRVIGRAIYNTAELRSAKGEVLARSRGKFIEIDAERMFAREYEREQRKKEKSPSGSDGVG